MIFGIDKYSRPLIFFHLDCAPLDNQADGYWLLNFTASVPAPVRGALVGFPV